MSKNGGKTQPLQVHAILRAILDGLSMQPIAKNDIHPSKVVVFKIPQFLLIG